MKAKLTILYLILLTSQGLRATTQTGDLIFLDGGWRNMSGFQVSSMLEPNLNDPETVKPERLQQWQEWVAYREKHFFNSGSWDGMVGKWEIREGMLVLVDLLHPNEAYRLQSPKQHPFGDREIKHLPLPIILGEKQLPLVFEDLNRVLRIPIDGYATGPKHWPSYGVRLFTNSVYLEVKGGKIVNRKQLDETILTELYTPGPYWDIENPYFSHNPFHKMDELDDSGDWIDLRLLKYATGKALAEDGSSFRTRGILFWDERGNKRIGLAESMIENGIDLLINKLPDQLEHAVTIEQKRIMEARGEESGFSPFNIHPVSVAIEIKGVFVIDGDLEYIRVSDGRVLPETQSFFKYTYQNPDFKWIKPTGSFNFDQSEADEPAKLDHP